MIIDTSSTLVRGGDIEGLEAIYAMGSVLAEQGHRLVTTGCLVGDRIIIRDHTHQSVWQSGDPEILANALGIKTGLVDRDEAWVPAVAAVSHDESKLIVAVRHRADPSEPPKMYDTYTVETEGRFTPFGSEPDHSPEQRGQLQTFLATQFEYVTERGGAAEITPIQWPGDDHPVVSVWVEPSPHLTHGYNYFIEEGPVGKPCEPVDPAIRRTAEEAAELACGIAACWNVQPINLKVVKTRLRGFSTLSRGDR